MFAINIARLKKVIPEKGLTQNKLADYLSMDRATFYRKMKKGGGCFTLTEVYEMCSILSLTLEEMFDIFLNKKSH